MEMSEADKESGPNMEIFTNWVLKNYGGNSRTKTITHEKYVRICKLIKGEAVNSNAKFRFWVRNKGFRLIHYDEINDRIKDDPNGELYVSLHAREENNGDHIETFLRNKLPAISFFRKVAIVEEFYGIIKQAHVDAKGQHAGQKKTYRLVSDTYAFLPREAITFYLLNCELCKPRIQKYGPAMKEKSLEKIKNQDNGLTGSQTQLYVSYNERSKKYNSHDFSPPIENLGNSHDLPNRFGFDRSYNSYDFGCVEDKGPNIIRAIKNNVKYKHTIEEQLSPGPPSLCFIPKKSSKTAPCTPDHTEKSNHSGRISSTSIISKISFYNEDQLRDIDKYIQERKKLYEAERSFEKEQPRKNYLDEFESRYNSSVDHLDLIKESRHQKPRVYKRSYEDYIDGLQDVEKLRSKYQKLDSKDCHRVPLGLGKSPFLKAVQSSQFPSLSLKRNFPIYPEDKYMRFREMSSRFYTNGGSVSSESPESTESELLKDDERLSPNYEQPPRGFFPDSPEADKQKLISPIYSDACISKFEPIHASSRRFTSAHQNRIDKLLPQYEEVIY